MMSTRVWFETHATTYDNEAGVATGWLPGELSPLGRQRAAGLGDRIAARAVDAIYCSDLRRAVQTASIGLERAGGDIPLMLDWRLRECDYGQLNGAVRTEIDRYVTDATRCYPGGESWAAAVDRAGAAIGQAADRHVGGTIMIIGHTATRLAVRVAAGDPTDLSVMLSEPFDWQPGWEYALPAGHALP